MQALLVPEPKPAVRLLLLVRGGSARPDRERAMRYRTIVADPPWPYREGFTKGAATGRSHNTRRDPSFAIPSTGTRRSLPYASMTLEEIASLDMDALAHPEGARLFLWTTNRYLGAAFRILDAWGFDHRETIVWHKSNPSPFSGNVAFNAAEYLLVAQIGRVETLSKAHSSVLHLPVPKEHSRKPEAFLDLVEQVSPEPRVELFARRNRIGWDTWGDQSLPMVEMPA